MMLSRAAARQPAMLAIRSFSSSHRMLDDSKKSDQSPSVRVNPLVGNYVPAQPSRDRPSRPPVSTEHQRASQPPSPDRAPTSSAEVPPNADMPPPPSPPRASSIEHVTKLFGESMAGTAAAPAATPNKYPYNAASSSFVDISKILENSAAAYARSSDLVNNPLTQATIRTSPVVGKTVFVGKEYRKGAHNGGSVVQAFAMLDRVVRDQKIKQLAREQKFHERKGMMRKRLKMVRWRRRFKEGFKATASRVLELKKQGW